MADENKQQSKPVTESKQEGNVKPFRGTLSLSGIEVKSLSPMAKSMVKTSENLIGKNDGIKAPVPRSAQKRSDVPEGR